MRNKELSKYTTREIFNELCSRHDLFCAQMWLEDDLKE